MSPLTHRGRRRLDRDQPVERLRGLLAEDLREQGRDQRHEPDADLDERRAGPGRRGTISGSLDDLDTQRLFPEPPPSRSRDRSEDRAADRLPDPAADPDQDWAPPVRLRLPWVSVLLAGLVVLGVLLAVLTRGGGSEEVIAAAGSESREQAGQQESQPSSLSPSSPSSPEGAGAQAPEGAGGLGPSAAPSGSGSAVEPGPLTVHVVGEVRRPGLIELPGGSRVGDAVEAAGGLTEAAAADGVNLAAPAVDGSQVHIPDRALAEVWKAAGTGAVTGSGSAGGSAVDGGTGPAAPSAAADSGPGAPVPGGTSEAGEAGGPGGALIDLNQATAAELEELPKVGPVLAQRIIEHRDQVGGFRSVEELDDVSGIGPAMMAAIAPLVAV